MSCSSESWWIVVYLLLVRVLLKSPRLVISTTLSTSASWYVGLVAHLLHMSISFSSELPDVNPLSEIWRYHLVSPLHYHFFSSFLNSDDVLPPSLCKIINLTDSRGPCLLWFHLYAIHIAMVCLLNAASISLFTMLYSCLSSSWMRPYFSIACLLKTGTWECRCSINTIHLKRKGKEVAEIWTHHQDNGRAKTGGSKTRDMEWVRRHVLNLRSTQRRSESGGRNL